MALSRSVLGTTPHAIRWQVGGDADDNTSITAATLIAELASGPLKALIEQADAAGNAAWTALGKANMAVEVVQEGSASAAASMTPGTVVQGAFIISGGARHFAFVVITGSDVVDAVLSLRQVHSMIR